MSTFNKIKPSEIEIDRHFQRELNEKRARVIASKLDLRRIGVPVVSRRSSGEIVALDGQHRVHALRLAGANDPILCEVHIGLTVTQEAELFLKLNNGRSPVKAYDKWRARVVAEEPGAMEIKTILDSLDLRISRQLGPSSICAIDAIESVHWRNENLKETLGVLKRWANGLAPQAFDCVMIKTMSLFLKESPDISVSEFQSRLSKKHPKTVLSDIEMVQNGYPHADMRWRVSCNVLRNLYNYRNKKPLSYPLAGVSPEENV